MLKLTQFADDTTIILDGTVDSLQAALNILEIFRELSGLKMNAEKTKVVWIGSEMTSKRMLNTSYKLRWGDSHFNLLGINFSSNLSEMPDLNYENAIMKAKQIINSWRYRYLTPLGKITIIKTLILSKFTHLFMTLPTPVDVLNRINGLLFSFLWDGKPDKINRKLMCNSRTMGGLNMVNVHNFEKSLKLKWIKLIFTDDKKDWRNVLFNTSKLNAKYLSVLGSQWCLSVLPDLNPFWKMVFSYYVEFCQQLEAKSIEDILSTSLWLNKPVGTDNIFFGDWFKNGILSAADILKTD